MDQPNESTAEFPPVPAYPTSTQRRILWTALTALAATSLLGVAALVFFGFITFLSWCYPILLPIGLAMIIALVLEPIVDFVQKRGLRREAATLLVCLFAVIGFLLFFGLSFTAPGHADRRFSQIHSRDCLNDGVAKLQTSMDGLPAASSSTAQPTGSSPASGHPEIQAWLKNNIPALEQAIEKNIANLAYSALGPVGQALASCWALGSYRFTSIIFSPTRNASLVIGMNSCPCAVPVCGTKSFRSLPKSTRRSSVIFAARSSSRPANGVLTFNIGLWAIGIPYSLVLGIITGALSIVPFLGIIASIIPALLLGYLSAKNDPTLNGSDP